MKSAMRPNNALQLTSNSSFQSSVVTFLYELWMLGPFSEALAGAAELVP